jgi:hypothetical protein
MHHLAADNVGGLAPPVSGRTAVAVLTSRVVTRCGDSEPPLPSLGGWVWWWRPRQTMAGGNGGNASLVTGSGPGEDGGTGNPGGT